MSPVSRQLSERVESVRAHLRRRVALAVGAWVAGGVVLVLAVAWFAVGTDGWRPGSNVPALLDALIVAWIIAGLVAFRVGTGRWFGEVTLSRAIERAAGLQPGVVRGSLELTRSVRPGVSTALVDRAMAKTVAGLDGRGEEELSGELGRTVALWSRRGLIASTVAAAGLVALGVASPSRTADAWAGFSSPVSTMLNPTLAPLVVAPGTIEVMRGSDVRIDIEAVGRLQVDLHFQIAGDVARSVGLEVADGLTSYAFEDVSASIDYRVRAPDGAESAAFRIVPIDPLFVSDLVVNVEYPGYTGIPPDEYRGDPPPLRLPAGTRLTFEGLASRPLSAATLVDSLGAAALTLDVDGTAFSGAWMPQRGGVFPWIFLDEARTPAEVQPDPLEILVVPDSIPEVAILLPAGHTVLPLSLQQPLVIDARDDYGLARFELVAYRVTVFGERQEPVVQGLTLGGTRGALARPALDLTTWGLLPGDTVRYFARVIDTHPSGQVGVSAEYALRMPMVNELRREAEETLENVADRLDALRAEAERQAVENANQALENQAQAANAPEPRNGNANEPAFQQREQMQRAADQQQGLMSQVDSLSADLAELQKMLEDLGQADPELAAQLEELQELLQQLSSQQELERDLEASPQRGDTPAPEMPRDPELLRQQLEEAVEQFRRAAVEQDFRATTDEAEELARQQRALAEAMREADNQELRAEQQSQLGDRAQQLDADMQALAERLNQLDEPQAAADVEQARQSAADSRQQMQRAEQQAQQGNDQQAAQQAQQAADQMQQAADQMQQAQGDMQQQTQADAQAALQQGADDALSLARSQAGLMQRMQGASPEQLSQMRGEQAAIQRGLQNLAENLQAGTQQAGSDPALSAQVGRAMEATQQALQALDTRNSSASQASQQAQQALNSMNQLAMMAMASAEQAGSVGAGQSGQDIAEQVGQLAQRQGDLVAQGGEMAPMRLGEQAMRQQLERLAEQQGQVARDIETASREPGADDALGDLEELAREADELAQQLAQGRMTPEVLQRQERLFHRLLDAGRSLEQEESSEERESTRAGEFERGDVAPLTDLQLGLLQFELPDGEHMRALTPAVRQLVLEYFERLNRR
ncbi:MAG: hypothetical protein FJ207_01490 [Gemmatimonadetes bacterium]|nr:hypothetical protein [Gemmatimonadota bacterium]